MVEVECRMLPASGAESELESGPGLEWEPALAADIRDEPGLVGPASPAVLGSICCRAF